MTYSATAPAHFVADFDRLAGAILAGGWVRTLDDGFRYIVNAPDELTSAYKSCRELGYANGWFS
jgi:hypothetical protein